MFIALWQLAFEFVTFLITDGILVRLHIWQWVQVTWIIHGDSFYRFTDAG